MEVPFSTVLRGLRPLWACGPYVKVANQGSPSSKMALFDFSVTPPDTLFYAFYAFSQDFSKVPWNPRGLMAVISG